MEQKLKGLILTDLMRSRWEQLTLASTKLEADSYEQFRKKVLLCAAVDVKAYQQWHYQIYEADMYREKKTLLEQSGLLFNFQVWLLAKAAALYSHTSPMISWNSSPPNLTTVCQNKSLIEALLLFFFIVDPIFPSWLLYSITIWLSSPAISRSVHQRRIRGHIVGPLWDSRSHGPVRNDGQNQ